MDSIRKDIDEELALRILGTSNLPGRSMCSKLEAVYSDGTCPNIYAITGKRIGEKSAFGKVYQACCDNNCEYVAKWQPKIKLALREARIQYDVAREGLAPSIHEVWECDKGVIIIMDSLETTLLKEFESLSKEQEKTAEVVGVDQFKRKCKEVLVELGKPELFDKVDALKNLKEFRVWRNLMNKKIKENRLDISEIGEILYEVTEPDDNDQMNHKSNLLRKAVSLLERLHSLGYYHGDAHLNNFMRDKEEYKLIDFGLSGPLHNNDELIYDYFKLGLSLNKLIDARPQLEYLKEVFLEIPIIQLNLNALGEMDAKYEEYIKKRGEEKKEY